MKIFKWVYEDRYPRKIKIKTKTLEFCHCVLRPNRKMLGEAGTTDYRTLVSTLKGLKVVTAKGPISKDVESAAFHILILRRLRRCRYRTKRLEVHTDLSLRMRKVNERYICAPENRICEALTATACPGRHLSSLGLWLALTDSQTRHSSLRATTATTTRTARAREGKHHGLQNIDNHFDRPGSSHHVVDEIRPAASIFPGFSTAVSVIFVFLTGV